MVDTQLPVTVLSEIFYAFEILHNLKKFQLSIRSPYHLREGKWDQKN